MQLFLHGLEEERDGDQGEEERGIREERKKGEGGRR